MRRACYSTPPAGDLKPVERTSSPTGNVAILRGRTDLSFQLSASSPTRYNQLNILAVKSSTSESKSRVRSKKTETKRTRSIRDLQSRGVVKGGAKTKFKTPVPGGPVPIPYPN
jgi:hypothetical protein